MRTETMMLLAATEAELSTLEIKHGAVLVRSGKIIASGHNSDRSRMSDMPGTGSNTVSMHSEVAALHAAHPWVLQG